MAGPYRHYQCRNRSLQITEHVIESSEGGGGNYSRRAKRHALKKSQSGEEHMDATLEISALKDQLIWEGSEGKTPRVSSKYLSFFLHRDVAAHM